MTRKRFIKLLMSKGVPRNIARCEAEHQSKNQEPYCLAYHCLTFDLRFASALVTAATQAVIMVKKFDEMSNAFHEAMQIYKQEKLK